MPNYISTTRLSSIFKHPKNREIKHSNVPGAGGYREHDILVVNEDGTVDNITKFPLGPEHNVIPV